MASLKSLDEMYRHEAYVMNTVEGRSLAAALELCLVTGVMKPSRSLICTHVKLAAGYCK